MDTIFNDNPNLDVAYKTADGKYFYTENGAQNHAFTLKNKEVKKVVRTEDATETEEVKNEVATQTEKPSENPESSENSDNSETPEPSENSDNSEVSDNSEIPELSENTNSSENLEPSEEQNKPRFELKPKNFNKR
mgnify:CR=1 FL=1